MRKDALSSIYCAVVYFILIISVSFLLEGDH